ncbi:hypothetical protein E2C01_012021 [Portunus trituberculatus]|uniref:Uncharacterized protein n=1 Tax=Portunus trituberculatus TaxID=210409 RepID=A0A5B7DCT9_PORTR|nr:hypothetical protein [Portunus trituberculatus]
MEERTTAGCDLRQLDYRPPSRALDPYPCNTQFSKLTIIRSPCITQSARVLSVAMEMPQVVQRSVLSMAQVVLPHHSK